MAHKVWKGYLSLGLVNVPVAATCAARTERVEFNQLHLGCTGQGEQGVQQVLRCKACAQELDRSKDIEKGHKYKVGKETHFVRISDEELKSCTPKSSEVMEIIQTVKKEEIDPILLDASYFLEPEEVGRRGYQLILTAIEQSGLYALAKVTKNNREHVVVLRPFESKYIMMHEMFYVDEVRERPAIQPFEVKDAELSLAKQILEQSQQPFNHQEFYDGYRQQVERLIQDKRAGKVVDITSRKSDPAPEMDLLAALAASVKAPDKKVTAEAKPDTKAKKTRKAS